MNIIRDTVFGFFSVLKITGAPMLYRYPFRNSAEGMRSDWARVAGDIEQISSQITRSHHGG